MGRNKIRDRFMVLLALLAVDFYYPQQNPDIGSTLVGYIRPDVQPVSRVAFVLNLYRRLEDAVNLEQQNFLKIWTIRPRDSV